MEQQFDYSKQSKSALAARDELRQQINQISDPASREGIVSDTLAVIVVGLAQLTVALTKVKTVADVAAAAQPLAEIAAMVDSAVKSGELRFPYTVKEGGVQGVLADMTLLANGVSAVLAPEPAGAPLA